MLNTARPRLPIAAALLAAALGPAALRAPAADCNENGVEDLTEVAGGQESDCDGNGIPDSCDVLRVNQGLSFHEKLQSQGAPVAVTSLLLAEDLDRDGRVDLALGAGSVLVLWGDGEDIFSHPDRFPLPRDSVALAAGDLDRDGLPDVAAGGPEGVTLLLQAVRRRFINNPSVLPFPSSRGALAIADLDGDRVLDIAFAGLFEVLIFLGIGDGTFAQSDSIPAGSGPIHIALADIDGDGDIDVATANSLPEAIAGSVSVFLNSGGGLFGAPRSYGVGPAPSSIAAGDLDRDGRADVVVTNSGSADVSVLRAGADGRLTVLPRLATGGSPLSAALADIDLDGDLDIAVSRLWDANDPLAGSAVTLFWNHANGDIRRGFDLKGSGRPVSVVARDLFAGDALEVAMLDAGTGDIHILIEDRIANHPDCNHNLVPDACDILTEDCNANGFNDTCDVTERRSPDCNRNDLPDECEADCNANFLPDDCDLSSRRSRDCNENGVPDECDLRHGSFHFEATSMGGVLVSMTVRDLDGNGFLDLAGFDLSERLVVFWNEDGALEPSAALAPSASGSSLAATDLDGDLDDDLVVGDRTSRKVRVLVQSGRRSFSPGPEVTLEGPPGSVVAADLDGDGLAEIAALNTSGAILIFDAAGNEALQPIGALAVGAAPGFLAAADIDGDGARDLACLLRDGSAAILWNHGDATFAEPVALSATLPIRAPDLEDIDRDGDLDLAAAEGDDAILFAQFIPRVFERRLLFRAPDIAQLLVTDADLDGLNDLVIGNRGRVQTGLEIRRGDGSGAFGEPHVLSTPVGLEEIAAADLDRSTSPEVVATFLDAPCPQCPLVGRIFLWRNRTLPPISIDVDRNGEPDECDPDAFHRGDADGDGSVDLSDAVFTLRSLFQGGPQPGCAEAADADNDGSVGVSDPVSVLEFLFRGGPPPASPGPPPNPCGLDPDAPGGPADLGCAAYQGC